MYIHGHYVSKDDIFTLVVIGVVALIALSIALIFYMQWRVQTKQGTIFATRIHSISPFIYMALFAATIFLGSYNLASPFIGFWIWSAFGIFALIISNRDLREYVVYQGQSELRSEIRVLSNMKLIFGYGGFAVLLLAVGGMIYASHSGDRARAKQVAEESAYALDANSVCPENLAELDRNPFIKKWGAQYEACRAWLSRTGAPDGNERWNSYVDNLASWFTAHKDADKAARLLALKIAPLDNNATASTTPVAPQPTTGDLWK